jgi:RHS repeat-associated protein
MDAKAYFMNEYSTGLWSRVRLAERRAGNILAGMIGLLMAVGAQAQGLYEWETYEKRVTSAQSIEAAGSDMFGDSVSLQTGALSFTVTDVDIPGNNSLPVRFTRSYAVNNTKEEPHNQMLADWKVDVPRISGRFATEWVAENNSLNRCSNQTPPPRPADGNHEFPVNSFWNGIALDIPGVASGELLVVDTGSNVPKPTDGPSYKWTVGGQIYVSCLNQIQSPGEGFLAITPDGTRYYFDRMAQRDVPGLSEAVMELANGNTWARHTYRHAVKENSLYVTRVVDRFQNSVEYSYSNLPSQRGQPTKIIGKNAAGSPDGREINIYYNEQNLVREVTAGSGASLRRWTYQYGETNPQDQQIPRTILSGVTLPDFTSWSIQFQDLSNTPLTYRRGEDTRNCLGISPLPDQQGLEPVGTIIHPSGAIGRFKVGVKMHGRSNVNVVCEKVTYPNNEQSDDLAHFPVSFNAWSLLSKEISAPSVPVQSWLYDYHSDIMGVIRDELGVTAEYPFCLPRDLELRKQCSLPAPCNSLGNCDGTSLTFVTRPDGSKEKYVFGNSWQYNEGKLLRVERQTSGEQALESVTATFDLSQSNSTYPARYGSSLRFNKDGFDSEYHRPQLGSVTERDGVTFSWTVQSMDVFARPLQILEESGLQFNKLKTTVYHHDFSKWVIGQLKSSSVNGQLVARAEYYPTSVQLHQLFAYGDLTPKQTLTYDSDGTVATVTDGLSKQTTLSQWHRGIPQNIRYHDNAVETAVVDGNGWIKSTTDPAGRLTSYEHDPLGRVRLITPPNNGAGTPWAATTLTLTQVPSPQPGLAGPLWLHRATRGGYQKDTYLDALYRPVLVHESGDGKNRFSVARFDTLNRASFSSFPVDTWAAVSSLTSGANSYGTHSQFDELGRLYLSQERSAAGNFNTQVAFLPGFRKQITNPRGQSTIFSYQAFGAPSEDAPVRIEAPEGQVTIISRDAFGKPLLISRTGVFAGVSSTVNRSYQYDTQERLCTRYEPETGVSVFNYDAADNIDWSAHGRGLAGNCANSRAQVITSGAQISRSYDARNRLKTVTYPDLTAGFAYDYWPDGKLKTADRNGSRWTYTYNTLGMLESESLSFNGQTRAFTYDYNALGHLRSSTYPGGEVIDHAPDALGQSTRVGNYATNLSYHANGAVAGANFGNGVIHTRTLNDRLLPRLLTYERSGQVLVNLQYAYDPNGNVDSIDDLLPNALDQSFGYDGLDRLTGANAVDDNNNPSLYRTGIFTYDVFDNLRRHVVGNFDRRYEYGDPTVEGGGRLDSLNEVNIGSSITFRYDTRGNMTNDGPTQLTFDLADTVTQVNGPSGVETYLYDANGHRIQATTSGGIRYPVYTKDGLLRAEYGAQTETYYYLGSQLIARNGIAQRIDLIISSGFEALVGSSVMQAIKRFMDKTATSVVTTWYLTDHLGSNIATTDVNGAVIERSQFAPFGERWGEAPARGPGYTGHFEDGSGYNYMKARYFGGVVGRFVSPDPVGVDPTSGGNFNRYWYANNNPYKFTDPDGRETAMFHTMPQYQMAAPQLTPTQAGIALGVSVGVIAAPLLLEAAVAWLGNAAAANTVAINTAEVLFGDAVTTSLVVGGGLTAARIARDALVSELAPLGRKAPATVTAGYNVVTGEVAARACGGGKCAEPHVVDALGGAKENVKFTPAARPRTGNEVPICPKCEAEYGRDAFPEGTKFKSDEPK